MDLRRKKQGMRWHSLRHILGLSLPQLAAHLGKSTNTLIAIEGAGRNASTAQYQLLIDLAKTQGVHVDFSWLRGHDEGLPPTTDVLSLQQRIFIEAVIERYWLADNTLINKKDFSERLKALMQRMGLSAFQFAHWCDTSLPTVRQWLNGQVVPKRDSLRKMAYQAIEDAIPLSLEWLCEGIGELPAFDLKKGTIKERGSEGITLILDTAVYIPYFQANTVVTGYSMPAKAFKVSWPGFYLFNHEGSWIPVRLQGTSNQGYFNLQSLHHDLSVQITQVNIPLETLYPIMHIVLPHP